MLLYQILVFAIHGKNIIKSENNNKFKVSTPAWNEEFEVPDGSYSVLDIQDYFEYMLRKHETVAANTFFWNYVLNKNTILS